MDFTRKVHRAASIQRVPASRVGRTEKLHFEAHPGCHILRRVADQSIRSRPCRSAGSAPQHLDGGDFVRNHIDLEQGCAESSAIFAQAILAGQTASGRGRDGISNFAAGSDHRDGLARTQNGKVFGKVRVPEVV